MSYFDTPSSSDEDYLPITRIEVDPPSSPETSSSRSKTSSKKLSKKALGKQPATRPADDEDDVPIPPKNHEMVRKKDLRTGSGKQPAKNDERRNARNANQVQEPPPINKLIDLLRSNNQSDARVNNLEVYVGTISGNGNGDDEDKSSGSLPNNDPKDGRYGSQQTRSSLTQRQNDYEDGQDRLGEQQDVLASQQQRLNRRLADIEYCLHLSTPTRSESAPPRPTAPTAGLFPPWSEGYWGGSKSPSRLAGAWGSRSSRSSRGNGVKPSTESDSVAAGGGRRPFIGPPVTGRTAVLGPTSNASLERKSEEPEYDDDVHDGNKRGKSKRQKKDDRNEDEEEDEGKKPKPKPKIKVKPAGTTQTASKGPKILLKTSKLKAGDEEPKQKPTGATKPAPKATTTTLPKKRKAEELEDDGDSSGNDGDGDDGKPEQGKTKPSQKTATTSKPATKKPKIAPKTRPKSAPKPTPKPAPKAKPKAAPKSCKPKGKQGDGGNEDDTEDSDNEDGQGKPRPGTKSASTSKPASKSVTKTASKATTKAAPKNAPKTASKRPRTGVSKTGGNEEELGADDDDDDDEEDLGPMRKKAKIAPKEAKTAPRKALKKSSTKPAAKPAAKSSRTGLRSQEASAPPPLPPPHNPAPASQPPPALGLP
ncbi:hypothetical protein LX36DRAFT_722886 [Colletotrichum falcatum]|nr:hypothetical protein LX36DRAFT_722886 [Colletotrichum falcatum]